MKALFYVCFLPDTGVPTDEKYRCHSLGCSHFNDLSCDCVNRVRVQKSPEPECGPRGREFSIPCCTFCRLPLAQFILESGYGKSELAQNANNVFGMKCFLSGNTWAGSVWDDKSKYTKQTKEQNADGSYVTITADFP